MCGIAGIRHKNSQGISEALSAMKEALAHRGPDGSGTVQQGDVGLAHTRLSIIDLEGGQQPMQFVSGGLSLVANGEIYNYVELRRELQALGAQFETGSDSEVILHGYRFWGHEVIRRLHGMFAFCLYDAERQELFLGRDRLGIKPLFYSGTSSRFLFASELKAILAGSSESFELEPLGVVQFLENQFSTGEQTVFRGVRRLLPGHFMIVDRNLRIRTKRYWSALDVRPVKCSLREATEVFDDLMDQVMREHVRSDVPFGLYLSGGTDSAVLLSLLKRYQDRPVRTFSIGYENVQMADELDQAEWIAQKLGARHSSFRLSREDVFGSLPRSIWLADDLMRDYASLPTAILADRSSGELKVVFSGEGGDEVFGGYRRYRGNFFENSFKAILNPGTGGFRTRGQFDRRAAKKVFAPELQAVRDHFRAPFKDAWREAPSGWSSVLKRQYCDLVTALPDNLLVKADRMLMGAGVEGRVPFVDHRVVEFGLSLPDDLKIQGKTGKYFLKRWAERHVPAEHLYRSKRGFYVPVKEWLSEEFLVALEERLLQNDGIRQWFQEDGVRSLLLRQKARGDVSREVFSLMQFSIWHRMFVQGEGKVPAISEEVLEWV